MLHDGNVVVYYHLDNDYNNRQHLFDQKTTCENGTNSNTTTMAIIWINFRQLSVNPELVKLVYAKLNLFWYNV